MVNTMSKFVLNNPRLRIGCFIICCIMLAIFYGIVFDYKLDTPRSTHTAATYSDQHSLGKSGSDFQDEESKLQNTPITSYVIDSNDHVTQNRPISNRPMFILLVTYMRGGSSFLGEMFNQNDQIFYWFEPLAALFEEEMNNTDSRNWFLDDNLSLRNYSDEMKTLMFDSLSSVFTCRIADLPHDVLNHRFARNNRWNKSQNLNSYRKCLTYYRRNTVSRVESCAQRLGHVCAAHHVRVIKTVRMRMDLVLAFMNRFPDVKVVYEWRDPRGILNSRWESSKDHRDSNFTIDTDILCRQITFDLEICKTYLQRKTTDMTIVKYEDLAMDTRQTVTRLYNVLDLGRIPRSVFSWIKQNTHAESDAGPLSTSRTNSSAVAGKWKEALQPDLLDYITETCQRPLWEMSYENVSGVNQ